MVLAKQVKNSAPGPPAVQAPANRMAHATPSLQLSPPPLSLFTQPLTDGAMTMNESGAANQSAREWQPSVNPWLIAAAVMIPTFMEVLDTTIASVALPHIAGSLSATTDEATWVLTSYLVANAIILPASGWLAIYFGRKRFLIACIVIFTLASLLSGAALSLGMLVVARVLQGAGGGALQPLSQAILLESFPARNAVWQWPPSAWGWSWRRSSGRLWGAGSPTTTRGAGPFTSISRWGSSPFT